MLSKRGEVNRAGGGAGCSEDILGNLADNNLYNTLSLFCTA